jgi:deoxyribonuclease V
MDIPALHSWNLTPSEAIALQKRLADQVDTRTAVGDCALIAGADVSYNRFSPTFYAVVLVLRTDDWSIVEEQSAVGESPFPYIPGLLSFREAPILLEACARLRHRPDALMIDGQGFAHQRRCGIASHLGLWLRLPTIGCAKTRLIGEHDEPGPIAGDQAPLRHGDEVIGSVVRTKARCKPLYISSGYGIDLPSAVRLVLTACRGYRLPEPTRLAHLHVNDLRRAGKG